MFRSVLQSPKELDTGSYDGELATYSGGGYVQNLHFQKHITQAMLASTYSRWSN